MKRIEDAPKELRDMFAKLWAEKQGKDCLYPEDYAEQFFLAGFDVAMATGGLPERRKRTVSRIMNIDGQVYVTSTDGKVFVLQSRPEQWRALPDLPQD